MNPKPNIVSLNRSVTHRSFQLHAVSGAVNLIILSFLNLRKEFSSQILETRQLLGFLLKTRFIFFLPWSFAWFASVTYLSDHVVSFLHFHFYICCDESALFIFREVSELVISIFQARDLPPNPYSGSLDSYIKGTLLPNTDDKFQTKVCKFHNR